MATTTWQSSSSGDWSVGGDWSGGVPGSTDEADITLAFTGAAYTVSLSADESAETVLLGAANATLSMPFRIVLSVATLDQTNGTLDLAGTLSETTMQLAGGVVDLTGTIDGDMVQASGGTLDFAGMLEVNTLEADGVTLDANDGIIGGPGATQWDGALVLGGSLENLTIENGLILRDTGGTQSGEIDFTGNEDELQFASSTTLDGTGLADDPNVLIHFDSPGAIFNQLRVGEGVVLTLGANVSVLDDAAGSKAGLTSAGTIVNEGTITATGSTVTFDLEPEAFSNSGTVVYSDGAGGNFQSTSQFTNTGMISISGGGTVTVFGIANNGTIGVAGTSTLQLQEAATGSGLVTIAQEGTVRDNNGLTGTVVFLDATGFLGISFSSSQQPQETIAGFQGFGGPATHDTIELANYDATTIEPYGGDATGGNLILNSTDGAGTAELHLLGNYVGFKFQFQVVDFDDTVITVACFTAGTRILTGRGEVAVECLREGDSVATLAGNGGGCKAVRWIGRSRIDLDRHPTPHAVAPVRIAAAAFGDGMPHCDLLLSPDHAVYVDGVLIPVRHLVNGATIRREHAGGVVAYYHVELEAHGVLVANGLPCESYLDTGNRGAFVNGGPAVLADPRLVSGWHEAEHAGSKTGDGEGAAPGWRWTDGDAGLAVAGVLEVEVAMTGRYWLERETRQQRTAERDRMNKP